MVIDLEVFHKEEIPLSELHDIINNKKCILLSKNLNGVSNEIYGKKRVEIDEDNLYSFDIAKYKNNKCILYKNDKEILSIGEKDKYFVYVMERFYFIE